MGKTTKLQLANRAASQAEKEPEPGSLNAKRALLINLCDSVRDTLLARADKWPDTWDGHEIRELIAYAFEHERTLTRKGGRPDRTKVRRKREALNDIIVNNLY
jgi:hypothetical protein